MYSTNINTFNMCRSFRANLVVTDSSKAVMNDLRSRTSVRQCPRRLPVKMASKTRCDELSGSNLEQEGGGDLPATLIARDLERGSNPVISTFQHRHQGEHSLNPKWENELQFSLPSDRWQVRSAVSRLQDLFTSIGMFTEGDRERVGLALEECLLNAIIHGNLEVSSKLRESDDGSYDALIEERAGKSPFKDRRVDVVARSCDNAVEFTIRDEGSGFDVTSLPDPTDPEHITCVHGRGVLLMRSFMDEVRFNAKGNEVTLNKRKATSVACIPR